MHWHTLRTPNLQVNQQINQLANHDVNQNMIVNT